MSRAIPLSYVAKASLVNACDFARCVNSDPMRHPEQPCALHEVWSRLLTACEANAPVFSKSAKTK